MEHLDEVAVANERIWEDEVKKGCGFSVLYGPVRAADLPAFLAAELKTTPAMRGVTFTTMERLVLTPVELMMFWKKQTLWILLGLFVFGGLGPGLFSLGAAWQRGWAGIVAGAVGLFSGAVATPVPPMPQERTDP